MLSKNNYEGRFQVSVHSLDELVPKNLWFAKSRMPSTLALSEYSAETGRPSVDPVVLINIVLIQYLSGIRSMRQTIREIGTNVAYRWFLGYDFTQPIPHFTTN